MLRLGRYFITAEKRVVIDSGWMSALPVGCGMNNGVRGCAGGRRIFQMMRCMLPRAEGATTNCPIPRHLDIEGAMVTEYWKALRI